MPKDYPEFKSWKKLERCCKLTKTKCYIGDGYYCYIKISRKNKKGPRGPVIIFTNGSVRWGNHCERVICRRCYDKENKKTRPFLVAFFYLVLVLFSIVLMALFFFAPSLFFY